MDEENITKENEPANTKQERGPFIGIVIIIIILIIGIIHFWKTSIQKRILEKNQSSQISS